MHRHPARAWRTAPTSSQDAPRVEGCGGALDRNGSKEVVATLSYPIQPTVTTPRPLLIRWDPIADESRLAPLLAPPRSEGGQPPVQVRPNLVNVHPPWRLGEGNPLVLHQRPARILNQADNTVYASYGVDEYVIRKVPLQLRSDRRVYCQGESYTQPTHTHLFSSKHGRSISLGEHRRLVRAFPSTGLPRPPTSLSFIAGSQPIALGLRWVGRGTVSLRTSTADFVKSGRPARAPRKLICKKIGCLHPALPRHRGRDSPPSRVVSSVGSALASASFAASSFAASCAMSRRWSASSSRVAPRNQHQDRPVDLCIGVIDDVPDVIRQRRGECCLLWGRPPPAARAPPRRPRRRPRRGASRFVSRAYCLQPFGEGQEVPVATQAAGGSKLPSVPSALGTPLGPRRREERRDDTRHADGRCGDHACGRSVHVAPILAFRQDGLHETLEFGSGASRLHTHPGSVASKCSAAPWEAVSSERPPPVSGARTAPRPANSRRSADLSRRPRSGRRTGATADRNGSFGRVPNGPYLYA